MTETRKDIKEIINLQKLQDLMQKFTDATGTGTAFIGLDAEILVASGWQDICTKFYRINPESCKNCIQSDTALANGLKEGKRSNLYRCLNGLTDVAVPIIIDGEHLANLFIGQFLLEKPDKTFFLNQARKYGFDEKEFMSALDKVPVFSEEEVSRKIDFLVELAVMISDMGLNRLKMLEFTEGLEKKIEEGIKDARDAQIAAVKMMQEAVEARNETEKANTALDKMMKDLKESNEQLERFAYVASHDLQEPLRKVNSFTQLFAKKYSDLVDEKGKKYIFYITDGTIRMQQLISDLLEFSRINTQGKPFVEVETELIVKNIIGLYGQQLKKLKGSVTYSKLPAVMADETQFSMLFQNLIGNAIKFRKEDEPPVIEISAESSETEWIFKVKDNGIGIEEKYKDRIFIIFQRLHTQEAYEGTGIGLALCKQIVNRHGGTISFNSIVGQGTTFYFTMPKERKL